MAKSKLIIDTSEASRRITALDSQISTLETKLQKNKLMNLDTRVIEAQIKGLRSAISAITKEIAKKSGMYLTFETIKAIMPVSIQSLIG